MSLRSIFGTSHRVKKKQPTSRKRSPPSSSSASTPGSSSWPATLPRRKAGIAGNRRDEKDAGEHDDDDDTAPEEEADEYPLQDVGLVAALATDLTLRDVPQAILRVRDTMFSPLPLRGLSSALKATILSRRAALPPLVSASHLHAVLGSTPTAVERETAELVRAGVLRRVVVPGRGWSGEVLVLSADLERLLLLDGGGGGEEEGGNALEAVERDARRALATFLRENPGAGAVPAKSLPGPPHVDALVRAGFLANSAGPSAAAARGQAAGSAGLFARPEDRNSLISLATVARAASGTVAAVGGEGRSAREHVVSTSSGLAAGGDSGVVGEEHGIAVPGAGAHLKLVSGAVAHLTSLLARRPHGEARWDLLEDRWDGGVDPKGTRSYSGGVGRGAVRVGGTLPGRTRRWRDFAGLRFDFVLAEAVGAGLVEVFETGCVGKGVRLVSPP